MPALSPASRSHRGRPLADPAILPRTVVSYGKAMESIMVSPGQGELMKRVLGGNPSQEHKKVATEKFFEAAEKLGVTQITR